MLRCPLTYPPHSQSGCHLVTTAVSQCSLSQISLWSLSMLRCPLTSPPHSQSDCHLVTTAAPSVICHRSVCGLYPPALKQCVSSWHPMCRIALLHFTRPPSISNHIITDVSMSSEGDARYQYSPQITLPNYRFVCNSDRQPAS